MNETGESRRGTADEAAGDPVAEFRRYALRETSARSHPLRDRREAIKALVPVGWRVPLRLAATRAVRPLARLRARRLLRTSNPVRLHLGSGFLYQPDWVNVDILGPKTDLALDVTRSLPFPDDSVDDICHQHLISLFTLREALLLTEECRRVLKPGGTLRIAVIDGGRALSSYAGGERRPSPTSAPTPMLSVDALFYGHRHRVLYDRETLQMLCRAAGFPHSEVREFGVGRQLPNIDEPSRREISVYVEAWG
jgi:predicted SAM-dependent methyltransferase